MATPLPDVSFLFKTFKTKSVYYRSMIRKSRDTMLSSSSCTPCILWNSMEPCVSKFFQLKKRKTFYYLMMSLMIHGQSCAGQCPCSSDNCVFGLHAPVSQKKASVWQLVCDAHFTSSPASLCFTQWQYPSQMCRWFSPSRLPRGTALNQCYNSAKSSYKMLIKARGDCSLDKVSTRQTVRTEIDTKGSLYKWSVRTIESEMVIYGPFGWLQLLCLDPFFEHFYFHLTRACVNTQ